MRLQLRQLKMLSFSAALLLLAGCAGYVLGPSNGLAVGSRSVKVNLFRNDTPEPRLSEAIATSIRRGIQREGTYKLETHADPDVILDGVITKFDRAGVSFQPNDILTVRDFYLTINARVKAYNVKTGEVLFDQEVYGRTTIRVGPDLASAERQAVPLLAEEMSHSVVSLLADGKW